MAHCQICLGNPGAPTPTSASLANARVYLCNCRSVDFFNKKMRWFSLKITLTIDDFIARFVKMVSKMLLGTE